MKKIIRKIFIKKPFEDILVFLLGKFPNSVLKGLAAPNFMYASKSIRHCTRSGINYVLDISDYQNWLIYFHSDSDSSFGILQYIQPGNYVFDVGGNIGQTAMAVAKKTGENGFVYSFEPFPDTCNKFKNNLAKNQDIAPRISIENIGLAASPSVLNMYKDCETNSGANRMIPAGGVDDKEIIQVPVTTIDIFVAKKKIIKLDFIKIDVEGFEMQVLLGARETLTYFKPHLFIEADNENLKKHGNTAVELCKYLSFLGYKIYEEGNKNEFDFYNLNKQVNIFCCVNK